MTYLSQFFFGLPAGTYMTPANITSTGTDSAPVITAKRTFLPFIMPDTAFTIVEVGLHLVTAQAGAECRFGLWDDLDGVPGALIADFGILSLATGSGWKFISISQAAPQGAVWVSCDLKDVATQVTLRRVSTVNPGFVHGANEVSAGNLWRYFEQSITYGSALPANAGAVTASGGTDCPITQLRRAP